MIFYGFCAGSAGRVFSSPRNGWGGIAILGATSGFPPGNPNPPPAMYLR